MMSTRFARYDFLPRVNAREETERVARANDTKRIVVVLAPGFEEIEAVTPIDVLRRAGLEVVVAGVGSSSVTGSHGITIQCDVEVSAIDSIPDAIVLPGGLPGAENLANSDAVRELSLAVRSHGGICAAICAAPAVALSSFGLLDDRTATCYPGFEQKFGASTRHSDRRVVVDGDLVTSRGPGTALEFSLELVTQLCEEERSRVLAQHMLSRS